MEQDLKAKWVGALRSGKFEQAIPGYPFLPCPICKGVEGCDHSVPERAEAYQTRQMLFSGPHDHDHVVKTGDVNNMDVVGTVCPTHETVLVDGQRPPVILHHVVFERFGKEANGLIHAFKTEAGSDPKRFIEYLVRFHKLDEKAPGVEVYDAPYYSIEADATVKGRDYTILIEHESEPLIMLIESRKAPSAAS